MSTTANLGTRLAVAIGTHNVVCAPEELVSYAVDELSPAVIVRPTSAAEVVEVVRFALAEKLKVLPLGSRSKCEIGMAPTGYDVAVDMTGLHDVAHYDAGDLTLSIDAGMPLRELEIFLRPHKQFLPLAVPCFESTTAGGAIASGIDSVLRQQYGTARDFLIGADFVDGQGQLCKSGGRVVKNVTGYDLHKLLIGSLGTLAVITRLNFRTFPLPTACGGLVATFSTMAPALEYRHTLEKAGVPLTNLEVVSPGTAKMMSAILQQAGENVPAAWEEGMWCVYSSYEGSEPLVKRISNELEKHARGVGSRNVALLTNAEDEALGGMLREAFEWLRWAAPATVLYRLTVCGQAGDLISELVRTAQFASLRYAILLRTAGVIYGTLLADREEELMVPLQKVDPMIRAAANSHGGHAMLLHAPLKVKLKIAEAQSNQMHCGLQQRVKQAFDPSAIFVPGREVGGI